MSQKLRDLIRSVRACKTAAEERAIITKESALIRTAFKDETHAEYRHRNVAKLLYFSILGYPTHFGQMECIKLLASGRFNEKRIGYLALMLLLDEKQEVLTLVTNSLQMDLNHPNQFVAGLALTALGTIGSAEMARDLANDVDKHLKGANPYLRKKAALCTIRLLKRVPDLLDTFLPHIVVLLTDKNHNVLLCGVTLVTAVVQLQPSYVERFGRLVPALIKILRKLLLAGTAPEYDIGGVTDPFLQSKILYLLRILGANNAGAAEAMQAVLAQVATNTEASRNSGSAVLYEAVNVIMAISANTAASSASAADVVVTGADAGDKQDAAGLKVLALNILGRFLSSKDANHRYVALETLTRVINHDVAAVQRHRAVIVECLRDPDVSIRRRALDLVYALVNADNVRPLTKELLNYVVSAGYG
jgi:AP-1 complex subunit gamma-1